WAGRNAQARLQERQSARSPVADEGIHARKNRTMGMPCRPKYDDHPYRRYARALLSDVFRHIRLGSRRQAEIQSDPACRNEKDLRDELLLHAESHRELRLQ